MFELAASGPRAARAALGGARRQAAERQAPWLDPFLGFAAGGIAFAAGDWDNAVAELDTALERAEETGTGWISLPIGFRSYIDAHRAGPARPGTGWNLSGTAACRYSSGTTAPAGRSWPCWRPKGRRRRRPRWPGRCGPGSGAIRAAGPPTWPPT